MLVTTTYALPLIVGLGVTTDIADWKLGYFASLAKQVQPQPCRFDLLWTAGILFPLFTCVSGASCPTCVLVNALQSFVLTCNACFCIHTIAQQLQPCSPSLVHLVCVPRHLPTKETRFNCPQALFILDLCHLRDESLWKKMFLCPREYADYLILHYSIGLIACALLAGWRSLAILVDGSCCSSFSDWSV